MGDVDAAAVPCGFGRAIGNKVYLVSLFKLYYIFQHCFLPHFVRCISKNIMVIY